MRPNFSIERTSSGLRPPAVGGSVRSCIACWGQIRKGDVVVVWKLDRLARSLKDVLLIMERIQKAKAGFRSLTEAIDATTPAGRMMKGTAQIAVEISFKDGATVLGLLRP